MVIDEPTNTAGERVLAALREQLACYQRLARLAEAQRDHVQQGSVEALLQLLQGRQAVLDDLARLEQVLAPARRQWTALMTTLAPECRAAAEALVLQSRQLLEQITRSDQDDVMLLQQRKLNLGRQIGQAAASRQVNRAYASTAYGRGGPGGGAAKMDVSQ